MRLTRGAQSHRGPASQVSPQLSDGRKGVGGFPMSVRTLHSTEQRTGVSQRWPRRERIPVTKSLSRRLSAVEPELHEAPDQSEQRAASVSRELPARGDLRGVRGWPWGHHSRGWRPGRSPGDRTPGPRGRVWWRGQRGVLSECLSGSVHVVQAGRAPRTLGASVYASLSQTTAPQSRYLA